MIVDMPELVVIQDLERRMKQAVKDDAPELYRALKNELDMVFEKLKLEIEENQ